MQQHPETSIIIRAFNEEKHLPKLFDTLEGQAYRDFEIIIVDSGSYDRSRDIAEERADKLIRITSHDFTFGYSLNAGIKHASGRFAAILSAHTIPCHADWLENLIKPLRNKTVAMTYGQQIGMPSSRFGEAEDFKRLYGTKAREDSLSRMRVNNANSAIRRDLWERHPFDETLTGLEDIAWAKHWLSQGYRVIYEPEAALHHIHEETWKQIRHRYYREAVAAKQIGTKRLRSIPGEILRDLIYTLKDISSAFWPDDNPVTQRLTLDQRLREIIYYRIHKNYGTLKGLLKSHAMETAQERSDVLFGRTTNAVVIHGPRRASLEKYELPEFKPGDALIRVEHVAVCATDLEIYNGTLGYFQNGMGKFPIIPGHEFSGRIVALGHKVEGLNEGDPVVVECIQSCGTCIECRSGNMIGCIDRTELGVLKRNGAYSEYVLVPACFVHKLPRSIDLKRAALTEPLAVVLKGLRRLGPALEERARRCAVIGVGPLGHLCAKVLAHRGHHVTAFDHNPKRRALFDGTDIETSSNFTRMTNFNVIVEITGDPDVLDQALSESPPNAAILLLGLPYGKRTFSFETLAAYDKTVVGSVGSTSEDFANAICLLPKLDLSPYFQCSMPLEKFDAAWKKSKEGDVLKVIIDVGAQDA